MTDIKSAKVVNNFFLIVLLGSILFLVFAFMIPQNIIRDINADPEAITLEAVSSYAVSDDTTLMTYDVSNRPYSYDTLFVKSVHAAFRVMVNGEEIYALEKGSLPWMTTTGAYYNFIYLSDDVTSVDIEVTPLYKEIAACGVTVLIANGANSALDLSRDSVYNISASIADLTMGLAMLLFSFFLRFKNRLNLSLLYLGFFATALGAWSLSETIMVVLTIEDSGATSAFAFIALMFLVVPFIQFTKHYFHPFAPHADALSILALTIQSTLTVLHITGMLPFRRIVTLIHIMIGIAALYHVICFAHFAINGRNKRRTLLYSTALILLLALSGFDVYNYYTGTIYKITASRFGLLLYLAFLAVDATMRVLKEIQEARDMEILKGLAYHDSLTGLLNRNAYMEWMSKVTTPEHVTIVAFDLNDLKKCNDTYGHLQGDRLLKNAAQLIFDVFHTLGCCYRTGGDEFVVIIETPVTETEMQTLLDSFKRKQEAYNDEEPTVKMRMAYGFAAFDQAKDASVEALSVRADNAMYEHKRSIKNASFA